jgi:NitT/TauT family transport system substrate-binding protein
VQQGTSGLTVVPVAYAGEGQGAGPVFVTQRAGFFADEGLDVQIKLLDGAKRVVRGLLDGEVVFANLAAPAVVYACLDGAPLVYLTLGINQQFVVGAPGITSVKELAGKRISVGEEGQLGAVLGLFIQPRLEALGAPGVQILFGDSNRVRSEGLLEGKFEGSILSPPLAVEAKQAGCHFLVDFADYGLNFTLGGVATTRRVIEEQPDLVRKFVRAYVRGMHRYKTDKPMVMEIQQEYSGFQNQKVAEETYDITEPGFPRAPYPVTSGLQTVLDTLARTDPRALRADPREMVNDTFLRELDSSGYIDSLYK